MRVLRAFEAADLECVLIGAAAMGFHGLVRATEDFDLFEEMNNAPVPDSRGSDFERFLQHCAW